MTPQQSDLVERLRTLLSDESTTREVSMFGGRVFMVDDKILISAGKDGDLLVRVPADQHDELVTRAGARQAEMGAGRTMGPGWISVSAAAIGSDDQLSFWAEVALAHNHNSAS